MEKFFALRTADGREYTIPGFAYIGSDVDCLIRYNDTAISRHHAKVWVAQGGLWLADENSANGLFLNGWRIIAAQVYQLQPGDRLRLGDTEIELEIVGKTGQAAAPAGPARRLSPIVFVGIFGCLLVLGLGILSSSYFIFRGNTLGLAPGGARIMAVSTPQPLLKPQEYAASNQALAQAVAELNQSELAFIQAADGTTGYLPKVSLARFALPVPATDGLDEKIRQVAADAMRVAMLADSLSKTAAAQNNGSAQAGQVAGQYGSVAQLGAALVITAQDLRQGLARGDITKQNAAASVAEYGARLWNPVVNEPETSGNPFSKYLDASSSVPVTQPLSPEAAKQLADQIGSNSLVWLAASGEKITKNLSFPKPDQAAVNLNDPARMPKMSTVEGQADSKAAQQLAATIIQAGGGTGLSNDQTGRGEVVAAFWSAVAVSSPDKPGTTTPANLPAFPKGSVTILSQPSSNDIISNLITLDNQNSPTVIGQIPVKETQPLVSLSISNISIKAINKRTKDSFNTFEADVVYEFDVKWATNLATPQFALDCVSGNHFEISTTNGSQHITAKGLLILYPGAEDAFCYASRNGNTWGSASVHFLVGDSAEATQRAIQVETDSVSLDLTLTADAQGTLAVQTANAAVTQTVIAIQNAVSTEVFGTQTAEFSALITEIARKTEQAPPPQATDTPLPTATFTPILIDTFFHPGDVFAVSSNVKLQQGHLYRICLSGITNLTTGPAKPSDLDSVNGIKVPLSGCVVLEGNGSVATVSCGSGEPAEDPGGFTVKIIDLGPY